jgi:hypothetical protein
LREKAQLLSEKKPRKQLKAPQRKKKLQQELH